MDKDLLQDITERVQSHIQKEKTLMRDPLDVGLRVVITMRYLATGNSCKSLSYAFSVAPNTICNIVPQTCRAISAVYGDEVKLLDAPEGRKEVARGFGER